MVFWRQNAEPYTLEAKIAETTQQQQEPVLVPTKVVSVKA